MKPYISSLFAGILAGVVYHLIGVQSPAPPTIALAGLLGVLAGEQILPITHRLLAGNRLKAAWSEARCSQHMFGSLPGAHASDATARRGQSTRA
ncbi:XapX domain-containing protein [Burkholderia ubonensis]|uniref:XapX domain-containing protein n=1 Tax=Burkholderia ubonensis TaxID=101571 RepID=UPI0008FDA858|nr:XapX domain-containing protein [Burkholderia ubonensis]